MKIKIKEILTLRDGGSKQILCECTDSDGTFDGDFYLDNNLNSNTPGALKDEMRGVPYDKNELLFGDILEAFKNADEKFKKEIDEALILIRKFYNLTPQDRYYI